jgi:hypothetical protein
MFSGEPWGRCCSRFMLSMKSLKKTYYHPPIISPFDFAESFFLIPFTLLQQEDGPEPKSNDGSNFQFSPGSLWQKRTPPSKSIMQIQPSTAKLTPKRRRSSDIVAPWAHAKMRKELVRKIQKAAGPSSTSQEALVASQVWITPFVINLLLMYILLDYTPLPCSLSLWTFLVGRNPHAKKTQDPDLEDVEAPVNALITLQDPDPKALEGPTALIDAPVAPQGLQESVVTSSTANLPLKGARLQEPTAASSAVTPPSERVNPQEPIVASPLSTFLLHKGRILRSRSLLHQLSLLPPRTGMFYH